MSGGRVVMKFGGTSVGSAEALERTAEHVLREKRDPIVVVSAMGGVTDLLLEAGALARDGADWVPSAAEIRLRHERAAAAVGLDGGTVAGLMSEMERLLAGVSLLGELSPRVSDALLAIGERTSVHLMAAALGRKGASAHAWMSWELGLRSDNNHGKAEPLEDSFAAMELAIAMLPPGVIPVVTGFIARSPEGRITTLGRGGSDFSAALIGAGAGASEIQIWTDVPGILRADPRVVPGAAVVPHVTFEEAAELAYFGAKVLHPRTVEPARVRAIPVRVLGTFHVDPHSPEPVGRSGTLISDDAPAEPVRALALQKDVQTVHVHSLGMLDASGFLGRVFQILASHRVGIDVVATSEVSISMTLEANGGNVEAAVGEISAFARVERAPGRSILCVVGAGLRNDTGLLARIFEILAREAVPVHVVSQGASRINITIVTEPPHGPRAIAALHEGLFG